MKKYFFNKCTWYIFYYKDLNMNMLDIFDDKQSTNSVEDNSFLFTKVLDTVPVDDLYRALSSTKIFSLRILSKKVKNAVDKMCLSINASTGITYTFKTYRINTISFKDKLIIEKRIKSLKNVNSFHKIVKLSITNYGFFMDLILRLIQEIKTLQHLNLSNNYIGFNPTSKPGISVLCTVSVIELVDQLQKIKLRTLNISNNYLGPKGLEILAKMLVNNTTMTSLNLAGNDIGCEGSKKIAEVLSQNQVLKEIILSNNYIQQEGANFIAEAIIKCTDSITDSRGCTSLTSLDLSSNIIGWEGVKNLILVQSQNTALTSLNLKHNRITLF